MAKLDDYPNSKLYWFGGWIYDFTKIATFIVFLLLVTHYFFVTIFIVDGVSMETTLQSKDIMLVNRLEYKQHPIKRGDVIALYFPGEDQKKFVKRVIGLPGEKVKIEIDHVYINNKLISEPYLNGMPTRPDQVVALEDNEYFIMGDNRELSSDSRIWGPLPENYIIGKTVYRFLNTSAVIAKTKQGLSEIKLSDFYQAKIAR